MELVMLRNEIQRPCFTQSCVHISLSLSALKCKMTENCDKSKEERVRTKTQRQKQRQSAKMQPQPCEVCSKVNEYNRKGKFAIKGLVVPLTFF